MFTPAPHIQLFRGTILWGTIFHISAAKKKCVRPASHARAEVQACLQLILVVPEIRRKANPHEMHPHSGVQRSVLNNPDVDNPQTFSSSSLLLSSLELSDTKVYEP